MASKYTVIVIKRARDLLAELHISFRQRGQFSSIAFADPQGGNPSPAPIRGP